MRDDRSFFRWRGWLLALAFALEILVFTPILAIWLMLETDWKTLYSNVVLVRLPSPSGEWTAIVDEYTAEGGFITAISADVYLLSREHPATTEVNDFLGIDTGGDRDEDPRIAWSAPNVLRVTVPNLSLPTILTFHIDGVNLDLHYNPDDPVARAKWQKKVNEEMKEADQAK